MGGLGCDNMTAIIVCLLQGGSYSDLAAKCSSKSACRKDLSPSHDSRHKNMTVPASYAGLREALYGDISDSPHNYPDGIPRIVGGSKLNDTLHSANTDLDDVIEISRQSGSVVVEGGGGKSLAEDADSSGTSGIDVNESLSRDSQLDMLQPIETTV